MSTESAINFIKFNGTLVDKETPVTVYFQSSKTVETYQNGSIDEEVGLTLKRGKKSHMYWFDSQKDKQKWIKENLTFARR